MTTKGTLTETQINFFDTFGYLVFPGLMRDRLARIIDAFEAVFQGARRTHDGTHRTCIPSFVDQNEELCKLLDDPRVDGIFTSLLGDDYNYMGSDGNYYVGDTGWHRDGFHEKYRHIKLAMYLDPVGTESGALRVIPGSHRLGEPYATILGKQAPRSKEELGVSGPEVPAQVLKSEPGDVVLFNHNLFHSSWGGSSSRRMFTLNVCQRYAEADLQELRDYISGAARFWLERAHHETIVNTASPARMRHLQQVRENDLHLAELSRQARASMSEPARG